MYNNITLLNNVAKRLKSNNIEAIVVEHKEDVIKEVKNLLKKGSTISNGGSESIKQCGIIDLINNGDYNFIDRTKMDPREAYIKAFDADAYFCSCNAITENGELYNVDGNSNRIAAIAYGPKSVIMIVGINKIVKNLDEAIERVKKISAPKNTVRLEINTYCSKKGHCVAVDNNDTTMCSGCASDSRICCNYLVSARQRNKDRIKVILVSETLGY